MCKPNNCNRGWDDCGENRCGGRYDYNNDYDPFEEVERIARRVRNRRCREDRCARQFCRCMRASESESQRPNDNNGCHPHCCNR